MPRYASMHERLIAHVSTPAEQLEGGACWEHDGTLNKRDGYPRVSVREDGRHAMKYAHHLMFQLVKGPIPEGHEVDHACHNHRCINPDHLQALPQPVNRAKMPPRWRKH